MRVNLVSSFLGAGGRVRAGGPAAWVSTAHGEGGGSARGGVAAARCCKVEGEVAAQGCVDVGVTVDSAWCAQSGVGMDEEGRQGRLFMTAVWI